MKSTSSTESRIESLVTADDLPERLALALYAPRPTRDSRSRLAPELTYGRHVGPAPHTARQAAVALVLFRRKGRWHLPLTERPLNLAHHGGQISLPGGAVEPREQSLDAALRELNEELGFNEPHLVVGQLAECYVFASDFLVTPWVIGCYEPGLDWQANHREVQRVIEMPLDALLDDQAIGQLTIERGPLTFHAPCLRLGDARVWGATCIILSQLTDLLKQLVETE